MSEEIVFEQPINERIRTFLRLEHLFSQFQLHLQHDSPWDTHSAIKAILDILSMVSRGDIKRETIKELERHHTSLQSFIEIPNIDHSQLTQMISQQEDCLKSLHNTAGNIGQSLQQNELLSAIRQRQTVPGGLCDFDLPVYAHWLHQAYENRKILLCEWFEEFEVLKKAIELILKVIRESTEAHHSDAENGFYQQNIDTAQNCLLIRVTLPIDANIFPEISAGKHRFSIRFLKSGNPAQRSEQVTENIDFKLTCCTV